MLNYNLITEAPAAIKTINNTSLKLGIKAPSKSQLRRQRRVPAKMSVSRFVLLLSALASAGVLAGKVEELEATVQTLIRQSVMDKFYLMEKTRSEGSSGVKQVS